MFNTYNKTDSKVVTVTKEIEKTISPDKVVEMYDAVRKEVEKSILRTITVSDNQMSGLVVEYEKDHGTNQKILLYRFVLNGKETIEKEIIGNDRYFTDQELVQKLLNLFANKITYRVLEESMKVLKR